MVPEARLEQTDSGLVAAGEGWFVLNARDARWYHRDGRGARLMFDSETYFPQIGVSLFVLAPREPPSVAELEKPTSSIRPSGLHERK
jgi:hypothetical protein